MIVGPKNAKRGKACALPLSAEAKIRQTSRFAKTRPVVPRAGKADASVEVWGMAHAAPIWSAKTGRWSKFVAQETKKKLILLS